MALVVNDRVKETTATTGTGTLTLDGAAAGFETFSTGIGNTNTTYYAIAGGPQFEVGLGTVGAGTLSRDTILSSSNSDNPVDFSAGTKDVFCTLPASKSVILDSSGNIVANNGSNLTNLNASILASGTVPDARFPATLPAISGANLTYLDASDLASGTVPIARIDLDLLTTSTADADGDFFVVVDSAGAEKKLTKANIAISGFDNDSGFTTNTGTVTQVDGGNGLTGSVTTSGSLAVGAGTGIDVAADAISVDVSDFMTNGANNRILTATGTDAMNAEANLTFDGTDLTVAGNVVPGTTDTYDLGASGNVWRNLYTGDLHLSNEAKTEGNEVDGTKGSWTIQEGAEDLYLLNNKSGKKYKFKLEEI
jgi:hypothetical protein